MDIITRLKSINQKIEEWEIPNDGQLNRIYPIPSKTAFSEAIEIQIWEELDEMGQEFFKVSFDHYEYGEKLRIVHDENQHLLREETASFSSLDEAKRFCMGIVLEYIEEEKEYLSYF